MGWLVVQQSVDGQIITPESPAVETQLTIVGSAISESSGLAISGRDANCLWTHNDSGGSATIYAIDTTDSRVSGTWSLDGIRAIDWEAMTTIHSQGEEPNSILIADVGDNRKQRDHVELIRFREPDPRSSGVIDARMIKRIKITYQDGPADCEAVWYD
ncbi:MAG: hypothetical protein AAF745_12780, partial [Planctomycetota bacterium]